MATVPILAMSAAMMLQLPLKRGLSQTSHISPGVNRDAANHHFQLKRRAGAVDVIKFTTE